MVPASAISSSIRGAASFSGGTTWPLLCDAIGNAFTTWAAIPGNVVIQGVSSGVVGVGTVMGFFQFVGSPALASAALMAGGMTGVTAPQIGTAIGTGLLSSLTGTLQYQGISTGVGSGTDVSLIITVNQATLTNALQLAHTAICAAQGGSGSSLPSFYSAISGSIVAILQTAVTSPVGVVTPSGPLGPGSSVGTTISFLV